MPIYSHSRISTYESCRLQYRFRYVDRIRTGREGIEAFTGSRVHDVLEYLYEEIQDGVLVPLPRLLSDLDARWKRRWHEGVQIVRKGRTAEEYHRVARECIERYYEEYVPFDQEKTLSLERRVVMRMDRDGRVVLQGYIDRLAEARDGAIEIHDYKTSESLPRQEVIHEDRQLALYQIGVQQERPERKRVRLVWHYLRHGKRLVSERSPEALENLKRWTIAKVKQIEAETEYPPRESRLCAWCEYIDRCPVWEGRSPPEV